MNIKQIMMIKHILISNYENDKCKFIFFSYTIFMDLSLSNSEVYLLLLIKSKF
jgi:hypothetical protein